MAETNLIKPQFLTNKLTIKPLSKCKNVWDFQLRDHFLTKSDLYILQCNCTSHKHNKSPCIIVTEPFCGKCNLATEKLITFESLMFHDDLGYKKLTKCCRHVHSPPCNRCINCQTGKVCIVPEPFECFESTGKLLLLMLQL